MAEKSECLFMNWLAVLVQIPHYVGFKTSVFQNVKWQ